MGLFGYRKEDIFQFFQIFFWAFQPGDGLLRYFPHPCLANVLAVGLSLQIAAASLEL